MDGWNNWVKAKMLWLLNFKFLIALNLNYNGGQLYKKISKFGYFKKWKNIHYKIVKFEVENCEHCVVKLEFENFELIKKNKTGRDQF